MSPFRLFSTLARSVNLQLSPCSALYPQLSAFRISSQAVKLSINHPLNCQHLILALRLWKWQLNYLQNVTFCLTQLSRAALLYILSLSHFVKVVIFHKYPDRGIYDIKSNVSKSPLLFTIWALHIYVQVVIFHNCSGIYDIINHMHRNLLSCYT